MEGVDHINVDIDDLDACFPFYRDTLDLTVDRPPADFHGEHAMFTAGDTTFTLVETGRADGWTADALAHPLDKGHVAFETDRAGYEAVIDRLDGQFPKQGPYDWGETEGFYFLDPDGNLLEVVTREPAPADVDRTLLTHDDV
ncbi:VOC family protein [Halolamina salifodinae]|uniref:Catechol 2,3-dioxygenase-like lactoylglutathione lyase family enzyme n=1 Tax=Halolamina salifodinae TaxID=1202767 RepID=A0A8T4GTC8_9EURY|nr:VOC family protein [Halolamina salifodinae]MBP1986139.1 catechol 2,3-dioxygenase-like lactoylglutathione lyase family enzyme [Halolamina salifodinae]